MLLLTTTSDVIKVVTGQAVTIDVHASWADNNAGVISLGRTNTAISTATTTTVVAAPSSPAIRTIPFLNIRNKNTSSSCDVTVQHFDGTNTIELIKVTLLAGEQICWIDNAAGWLRLASNGAIKASIAPILFKCLSADDTGGANGNTAQPWFPTAGAVAVDVGTYYFEGQLYTLRSAGTTSHTTGTLFGGTATVASIDYRGAARTGDTNVLAAPNLFRATATSSLVVKVASTSATEDTHIEVSGVVRFSVAGTFIPQFIYSAAPGGAPTIKRGTFFRMWQVGDQNVGSQGTWS